MSIRRHRAAARFIEGPGLPGRRGGAGPPGRAATGFGGMRLRMVSPAPWRPPTEVRARPEELVVVVELAALDEAHTDVGLYDDVLVVEGIRRVAIDPAWVDSASDGDGQPSFGPAIARTHDGVPVTLPAAQAGGIQQGAFRVEVPLPYDIDAAGVDATYEDGLLRIVLPRRPLDDVGLGPGFGPAPGRVA